MATLDPIPYLPISNLELILEQIFDILTFEASNQLVQGDLLARAQGTLTVAVQPTDGDQFTVGSKIYTLEDSLTNVDGNIQIGTDLAATQANIIAAFDLTGTAGVDYATLMTANTKVDVVNFVEDESIFTAKLSGTAGNSIITASSFTDGGNFFDAATLGTTRAGFVYDKAADEFTVVKEIHTRIDSDQFENALVNVYLQTVDTEAKNAKTDKKYKPDFNIDIYAKRTTDDDDEGLTKAALKCNRTMMQVTRILYDPRYERLGFAYRDSEDNLLQFIEKRSITSIEKFHPEESAEAVENMVLTRVVLHVEEIEKLSDIQGNALELIESLVTAETQ